MKTHSYYKEVININWDMCLISLQHKHTFDVHFQSMHLYIIMPNAYHTLQSYDFTVSLMEVFGFFHPFYLHCKISLCPYCSYLLETTFFFMNHVGKYFQESSDKPYLEN